MKRTRSLGFNPEMSWPSAVSWVDQGAIFWKVDFKMNKKLRSKVSSGCTILVFRLWNTPKSENPFCDSGRKPMS